VRYKAEFVGSQFKAEFAGGKCAGCGEIIAKGDMICYGEDSRVQHADCVPDLANVDANDTVLWSVTSESLERYGRDEAELARVAPPQRPICEGCRIELPVSLVCGTC
jgi:hypothetical protein